MRQFIILKKIAIKSKVLFLHGFNSSSNFAHQLYKLKNRDYDVVAFDFPGCGLSTSNSEITIQYYQKIALEFVNKINYKFDLVVPFIRWS
ncbi:alpha/beta hydrolase [Mycoplasmopsis cynos]|nr:alpha/beta hydrolase [Mycoplasmopsis cynos]